MKCRHDDCFTCPYPDCVIGARDAVVDPEKLKERREKRREYDRRYYQEHKKELSAMRHKAYLRRKAGKYI